mmetsp:Transcript_20303/g.24280  ORF Transcript_20303/g.24280 Transcript_20303/m.24280 type:complete len:355 (+) Transcript_20303:273-1337(+)|eukprot:CAMPEP_0197864178 /NCGR_PEP_ID=MMETSP1438-20131217/42202_1 /TAXON_ID=1461541 /ORGANISM="Pterosperma sp., Strain CCMP1384" /LENGTH=354 /DNA_ID=CAMNT_0043482325 /DNA_START=255 /DNA_END=1319 /DNA_ORIENTATION=+
MGQCFSKKREDAYRVSGDSKSGGGSKTGNTGSTGEKKEYSWDKRPRLDPKDYTWEQLKGETKVKEPGAVAGQQFMIDECEDCNLFLFDHNATVTIDGCKNCTIFIGPCESSIFIRDCTDCKCVFMCRQFRTRGCDGLDIMLYCLTRPVIETSKRLRFGCLEYHYDALESQMTATQFSKYTNFWSYIHDFTPAPKNWTFLPLDMTADQMIAPVLPEGLAFLPSEGTPKPAPHLLSTWGDRPPPSTERMFVLFPKKSEGEASGFLKAAQEAEGVTLLYCNNTTLLPDVAKQLVQLAGDDARGKTITKDLSAGKSIGFEFCGEGCTDTINALLPNCDILSTGNTQASGIYRYMGIEG